MSKLLELYGVSTGIEQGVDWQAVSSRHFCPYLGRECDKTRKSSPQVTIGTCAVEYGRERKQIVICPFRFLEKSQVFLDSVHLLTMHEPGNELHIVPEVGVPGGSVDYFLVSAVEGRVKDFVGIELQTLDTTGTVWPERQRFLDEKGVAVDADDTGSPKKFGMNWKMTAKTVLMQLYHKIETFESVNKHLVLVLQDYLLAYMRREFRFGHIQSARLGDSMHIHSYRFVRADDETFHIRLDSRYSTDSSGIAVSLGLKANPKVELGEIVALLESKISDETRLVLRQDS